MDKTTQNIMKMLPFDEKEKLMLLEKFDTFTPDQKHDIEDVIWDLYLKMYDLTLQENTHKALLRAQSGEEPLDQDFYKRIEEKTEKDLESSVMNAANNIDLLAARKAMEKIIHEIQAAKRQ